MTQKFKKIGWISISSKMDGGNIYGAQARKALSSEFDVELVHLGAKYVYKYLKSRYLKPFEWIFNFARLRGKKDLWVTHSFLDLALFSLSRVEGKKLALIYHIDGSVFPWFLRPGFYLVEKIFYNNLKKADVIVTMCDYWQNHFLSRGYKNVEKIFVGFPAADFNISEQEVADFKRKYKLEDKPIIYIGNCQRAKGVEDAYEALKDLDVYLVSSTKKEVDLPALNLDLDHKEYLKLLKASTMGVFMTRFNTGWDMSAQEMMFFKKPVLGTGPAGAGELMRKAGQIICTKDQLKEKVEYLLARLEERERLGQTGYDFAKDFTIEKFNEDWLKLIREVIND